MTRVSRRVALVLSLACGTTAGAQSTGTRQSAFNFAGDALARYEWTRDQPGEAKPNDSRWRLQVRPRLELRLGPADFGVGGEFNYSQDRNDSVPADETTLALVRDNYRSRDARLDLAYAHLKLGPVEAVGGRFVMPIALSEMIWDQDLRPQGGAASLNLGGQGGASGLVLTGIYAKGSHVFEDESVMFGGAATISLAGGANSRLQIVGSYLQFDHLERLQPAIRRQNTRQDGLIVPEFRVADVVARLVSAGQFPLLLVADYCWNTALDSGNRGLWFAVAMGTLEGSRAQVVYTYARIDRDAMVAAFNTDDFYWATGWEGHRIDLGTRTSTNSSLHAIAQWQRFKDSPDPDVSAQWVKRWRLEWRSTF